MTAKKKQRLKATTRRSVLGTKPATAGANALRKARLETLADVSKVLSHEISNLVGGLRTCVQVIRRNPNLTPDDLELLDIVQSGSERLHEINSQLTFLKSPSPLNFEVFNLHRLIDDILMSLRHDGRCRAAIVLTHNSGPTALHVTADREKLRQALWNLCLNAVQAMGNEGRLEIETQRAAHSVRIFVRDTGPGIPTRLRSQIFAPLYTTKSRGAGLGLTIVQRILEQHGGHITVKSKPGTGTCLTVVLPMKQK
jgi:signal transduction histidine kinase